MHPSLNLQSFCARFVLALVTVFTAAGWSHGQDHYCGVYSAYTVLEHYGCKVSFEELLKPQYVKGFQGSTAEGVAAALEAHGLAAKCYAGLGVFDLRTAIGPVILHVRGSQATRLYQHWVVYLGEHDGQAVIFDPSRGQMTMDFARLLAMWDTVGIATGETHGELRTWRTLSMVTWLSLILVRGCLGIPLLKAIDQWTAPTDKPVPIFRRLLAASVLLGVFSTVSLGLDCLDPQSLVRGHAARASLTSVHTPADFPVVGLEEAVSLHQDSDQSKAIIWIDARYQDDYAQGYIPGAINLPIDATFVQEDAIVGQLPSAANMVVYCQSQGCAYAHAVAERLKGHGYTNIKIFTPGYHEWSTRGAELQKQRLKTKKQTTASK